ncbi:MraY family glycosyltransferase [Timonella senegalensis]|uniref:MraY family glycosyltransferase n=1 Tax=Timonella senegalensis TaxID=1465825 RepID=UPI0002D8A83D|nr:MraY family glycosyltransferase [Timonella senegalensis]
MRAYALVLLISALATFLLIPFARWLALRVGAVTAVRKRDVHSIPTPRLGGAGMYLGMLVAFIFASQLPFLQKVFSVDLPTCVTQGCDSAWAIVIGGGLVCLLGIADDIWDLDWMTKLVGQILAAGFVAWQGVQLISIPIAGLTIGSPRLSLFLTVFVIVLVMNAVNFVDGLDGLAAGIVGIGGAGFFIYSYLLTQQTNPGSYASVAITVLAALVGACIGFLPYNFHPAKIFMGDSGSMLLGFMISSAAILVTGQIDPSTITLGATIPAFAPLLLPAAILVLPLLDMGLAVVRRLAAGKSPFAPDRLHIHHRLLTLGHSHRRAVLVMYTWSAVFAFGAVALFVFQFRYVAVGGFIAILVMVVITAWPLATRRLQSSKVSKG